MEHRGEVAKCKRVQRTRTIICAGSLRYRIDIYQRDLAPPLNPSGNLLNYDESFSLLLSTWAMVETPKGQTIFDDITAASAIDTIFYIRYTPIMEGDTERWIEFNLERYAIQNVINLERDFLFLKLETQFKGGVTSNAAKV